MIKLVVIDFDDTLCMTEEACFYIENETAKRLGHEPMTREAHLKNWGKPLKDAIPERLPGIDLKRFLVEVETVREEFVNEGKADTVNQENLQALDELLAADKKLAILTTRTFNEVRHLLHEKHSLSARLKKFYYKENTKFQKPDPKVFDQILNDFQVKPTEAIYLGDTITDARCTKEAGLHFIAILESGIRKKEDFAHIPVDFFATTFVEAVNWILAFEDSVE